MSERRSKNATLYLKSAAGSLKLELFDAAQWEDGTPGTVRLRVNGRWLDDDDGSRLYMNATGLADTIAQCLFNKLLSKLDGLQPTPSSGPKLLPHQRILLPVNDDDAPCTHELGLLTNLRPYHMFDGRWYVGAHGARNGHCHVPVDDIAELPGRRLLAGSVR